MEEGHFDNILGGCAGGQFIDAPTFALWTIFPCLRWPIWFYLTRIPYFLFLFCLLIYTLALAIVSAIFACACLPLSVPFILLVKALSDSSVEAEALLLPGVGFFGCVSGICLFVAEVVWLPFAMVMSLFLIPIQCIRGVRERDDREEGLPYWKCCTSEELSPFWCYPLTSILSLVARIHSFDDD
jgi:hypothetical protein